MIITVYSRFLSFYYDTGNTNTTINERILKKNKIFFHNVLINFITILNIL